MEGMEKPDSWEEILAGYVLGDLTPEEVAKVNRILAAHPELLAEIGALQETLALIPLALPKSTPPDALRSKLLVRVRSTGISSAANRDFSRFRARPKIWLAVLGSIAAVLVVGLGIDSYLLRKDLAIVQEDLSRYRDTVALLHQPDNRLLSLRGMGTTPAASGSLMIAPKGQVAVLSIQNLTPLPKGQVYRLWAMVNGRKVDCVEFNPDSKGKVFLRVPLDNFLLGTASVAVTVEPAQNTHQPTGEMVMQGGQSI